MNYTSIRVVRAALLPALFAAALLAAFFVSAPFAFAVSPSPGDIIINEFVSDGDEWVELLNTTQNPIDLDGWVLTDLENPGEQSQNEVLNKNLNGLTIPANGIIVVDVTDLNNPGDSIGLYSTNDFTNPANTISRVTYGTGSTVLIFTADLTAPASGKSGAYISGVWQTDQTPTKGWFNDAGQEEAAPLLSTIDSALSSAGIISNIGELTNPSATPSTEPDALYFEKSGQGKIVFEAELNLTDQATVAVLQTLGEAMEMSDGHIAFDSDTANDMAATGAKIYMYGLDFGSTPNIVVKDDAGAVIDPSSDEYPEITGTDYDPNTGTLTFSASHFTQFDAEDPVAIESADPADVGDFSPELGTSISIGDTAYLGRTTTYSGSATGTPNNTIKWRVTVDGPSALTDDMLDLDEVGFDDPDGDGNSIGTYHYPFAVVGENLVATGSCDVSEEDLGESDTPHNNDCDTLIGFSLDEDDVFTNADKIVFDSSAPTGSYTITYELVNIDGDMVLGTYTVTTNLTPEGQFNVCDDCTYQTIQSAIDAASSGDTINVAAGTYNENLTIDVENLVLQGPNAGVSGDSSRVAEAVIKPSTGDIINITVAGVSVDGFKLDGSEQAGAFNGIDLNGPDANILNNRIIGNAVGAGNNVHTLFPLGIRFNGGGIVDTDNALIQGNYFTLLHTAVFNQYSTGVVIDTNTFEDVRSSNANNGVADVTYTGNVYINSWNGPSFGSGISDSIGGFVIIENNTFGINNIAVNIREYDGVGGFPEDTSINSNDFSGTVGTGIDNSSGEVIDATSNWWGSANPDFDAITSGDVTVAPWFTNSGMTTDSTEDAMTSFDLASPSVGGTASTTADAFTLTVPNGTDVTALVPIIATSTGATTNPASGSAQDFTSPVTYTVTSADGSESREYVVTVNVVAENQTVPDAGGDATSNSDNPEVVITDPDQPVDITITSGTDNPTIDVSSFMTDDGEDTMGTLPEITINSDVADVVIPDNTVVTGPSGWDGIIDAPTEGTPAGGNAPAGFSVGSVVISIGSDAGTLFFDSPVTIVLPGVTGTVGYRPAGSDVWQTISACSGGTYNAPTPPVAPGECSINNGTDTKIVTFHFTSFGGMNAVSSGGGSTGGGGGGNSPAGGPQTGHSIIPGLAVAGTGAGTGIGTGVGSGTGSTGGEVLGAAAYNFARNFGFGARGADVDALQQALIDGGFLKITAPTGYFGVLTRAAVIAFQAKYGIAQIGVVGPVTRAQLNKGATPAGTSSITEPQVQALLGLLRSFGTDESIIANTEKALRNR